MFDVDNKKLMNVVTLNLAGLNDQWVANQTESISSVGSQASLSLIHNDNDNDNERSD